MNLAERPPTSLLRALKYAEEKSVREARENTVGGAVEKRYGVLKTSLSELGVRLFGERNGVISYVRRLVRDNPQKTTVRVLDFGCGRNAAMRALSKKHFGRGVSLEVTGVSVGDPRSKEERAFDAKHGVRFINQEGIRFSPSPGERFDLIVSHFAFLHLHDPLLVLKNLYHSLEVGGELYSDFSMGELGRKFHDGEFLAEGRGEARRFLEQLRLSGVDIEINTDGVFRIRRSEVPLKFPTIQYRHPETAVGNELYRLLQ